MYYLFEAFIEDKNYYTVTSETECNCWSDTVLEAYEDWTYYSGKASSKVDLNYCLENFTLLASSEDVTTLLHSCPELLL